MAFQAGQKPLAVTRLTCLQFSIAGLSRRLTHIMPIQACQASTCHEKVLIWIMGRGAIDADCMGSLFARGWSAVLAGLQKPFCFLSPQRKTAAESVISQCWPKLCACLQQPCAAIPCWRCPAAVADILC